MCLPVVLTHRFYHGEQQLNQLPNDRMMKIRFLIIVFSHLTPVLLKQPKFVQ